MGPYLLPAFEAARPAQKKRRKLTEDEVVLVEQAYEQLPEPVQEEIAEVAAPVLVGDGTKQRIAALMSERKREAIAAIVNAYIKHEQEREDEEIVLLTL